MCGRIGCHLALEEKVSGVICLGYPLCALGDRAKAQEEFEVLVGYFGGLEARARYAEFLLASGERKRATVLIEESLKIAARLPVHCRRLNSEWTAVLKRVGGKPGGEPPPP